MALMDELTGITPLQLQESAVHWDSRSPDEHSEWLRTRVPRYPILQALLQIRAATDDADAITRFEHWIQAYQHLITIAEQAQQHDVFLSYASVDSGIATELKAALQRKNHSCFLAEKDIRAGREWEDEIHSAMHGAKNVILLITPNSLKSAWVLMETGAAWALRKRLYPALSFVSPEDLVDPVRRFQARKVETSEERRRLVAEIVNA